MDDAKNIYPTSLLPYGYSYNPNSAPTPSHLASIPTVSAGQTLNATETLAFTVVIIVGAAISIGLICCFSLVILRRNKTESNRAPIIYSTTTSNVFTPNSSTVDLEKSVHPLRQEITPGRDRLSPAMATTVTDGNEGMLNWTKRFSLNRVFSRASSDGMNGLDRSDVAVSTNQPYTQPSVKVLLGPKLVQIKSKDKSSQPTIILQSSTPPEHSHIGSVNDTSNEHPILESGVHQTGPGKQETLNPVLNYHLPSSVSHGSIGSNGSKTDLSV